MVVVLVQLFRPATGVSECFCVQTADTHFLFRVELALRIFKAGDRRAINTSLPLLEGDRHSCPCEMVVHTVRINSSVLTK